MAHSSEKTSAMPVIWDLPVRIFHWALACLVVISVVSAEVGGLDAMDVHFLSGYAVLTLVAFRLIWGFVGSLYARFSHFLRSPAAALRYLRGWFKPAPAANSPHASHNPAGGYMVIALLALLLLQAASGLFADDDIFTSGPLVHLVADSISDRLTSMHHLVSKLIIACVVLHVIAIAVYEIYKKERLIGAMWHGRKALPAQGISSNRIILAAIIALLCGIGTWAMVTQL